MADPLGASRDFVRRHERGLTAAYLALVAALALVVALPASRAQLLRGIQAGVDWWDARWARRLTQGEALLAAGRAEEAVEYLERLDRIHPATNARHARDLERERLIRRLAQSLEATGRRGRVVETYQRLVGFDPRNYHNHYALGSAAGRLLSGWALAPEARAAYDSVLRIMPSHLPAVRGVIDYYMDRGEFIPVTETYRQYLDAYLVHRIELRVGDVSVWLPLSADGRFHDHEVSLPAPVAAERLEIRTGGLSLGIESLELIPPRRVGVAAAVAPLTLAPATAELDAVDVTDRGVFRALEQSATLRYVVAPPPGGVATIRLRVALFKPVDADLWAAVAKGFNNLLDEPGRLEADRRTVTLPTARAADQALFRLIWLYGGLGLTQDELAR